MSQSHSFSVVPIGFYSQRRLLNKEALPMSSSVLAGQVNYELGGEWNVGSAINH